MPFERARDHPRPPLPRRETLILPSPRPDPSAAALLIPLPYHIYTIATSLTRPLPLHAHISDPFPSQRALDHLLTLSFDFTTLCCPPPAHPPAVPPHAQLSQRKSTGAPPAAPFTPHTIRYGSAAFERARDHARLPPPCRETPIERSPRRDPSAALARYTSSTPHLHFPIRRRAWRARREAWAGRGGGWVCSWAPGRRRTRRFRPFWWSERRDFA